MPRVMRRPVRRLVMGPGARTRLRMRLARRLVVMLARRLMMRLARPVGLARRPVSVMMRRGPRLSLGLFHEDDGRSGGSHAHERGETEEEGTTAYLLRLGSIAHVVPPKVCLSRGASPAEQAFPERRRMRFCYGFSGRASRGLRVLSVCPCRWGYSTGRRSAMLRYSCTNLRVRAGGRRCSGPS